MIADLKVAHAKKIIKEFEITVTEAGTYLVRNTVFKEEKEVEFRSITDARDYILKRCFVIFSAGDKIPADFFMTLGCLTTH